MTAQTKTRRASARNALCQEETPADRILKSIPGVAEQIPLVMMLIDPQLRVRKLNKFAASRADLTRTRQANLAVGELLHCLHALKGEQGCPRLPDCDICGIRRTVRATFETGRAEQGTEVHVSILTDGQAQQVSFRLFTALLKVHGQPQVFMALEDITDYKRTEAALKASESALKEAQLLAGLGRWEWNVTTGQHTWSEQVFRIYGRDSALPAATYPEVKQYFTDVSWQELARAVDQALAIGKPYECDAEVIRSDGTHRWITARGQAERDTRGAIVRLYGTVQDITERKLAEERIARLNRALSILAGVDHAIVHIRDQQKLLDEICRVAVEKGGFKLAWVGMTAEDGSVRPEAKAGGIGYLEGIRIVTQDLPEGRGPVGTAIRENRPVIIADIDTERCMSLWRERAHRFGLYWVAAFPICLAGRVVGAFQLYAPRAGFFDQEEIRLLTQVSDDVSYALTALSAIAEGRLAEQQLRKSEQELADFFTESPLGLLLVDPCGRILRVNRAELRLLDFAEHEVCGKTVEEFLVEPEIAADTLTRLASKETVHNQRARIRQKSGSIRQVRIDANGLWEKEQLLHSRWFMRDITRQAELEREILTISDREQRRLGHDLHDDLCQQLAGLQFLSESLARDLASSSAKGAARAKEIAQGVQQAMNQTRDLARGLSPVSLEADGLMEGLRQLAERTCKIFRLDCRFRCETPILVPDHSVAIHLYRIAQEAVGNAVKHAKAERIEITLTKQGKNVRLAVTDDGQGIPARRAEPKGMGLRIMHYRNSVIGGSLAIRRAARGGTSVVCTVSKYALRPANTKKRYEES
jgi:PAS domain S-box-containing protein